MVLPHGSSSSMGSSWMPEPYPQTYKLSPLEALCGPQRVLGTEPVDRRAGGGAAVQDHVEVWYGQKKVAAMPRLRGRQRHVAWASAGPAI